MHINVLNDKFGRTIISEILLTVENLSNIKKILIIRLSSLGDILLTTPMIRAIKKQYPEVILDMLVRNEYEDALRLNNHLDNLFLFNRDERINQDLFLKLKLSQYDLVIDLQNNFRSSKISSFLKVKTLKFSKHTLDKFLLVNFKVNNLKDLPQIPVRYASVLPNLQLDENGLDLFTDKFPNRKIMENKNYIGICPGARHFTKRWPKEYFIELGNKLIQKGYSVLIFGGKIDRQLCSELENNITNSINLSNDDDLLQTASDMKRCAAIICNDSGLMHVASSIKTKVITIFGSSVKEFGFTPYNCANIILENRQINCRPCSHIGKESCPKKHFDCMRTITPEYVFDKTISFIQNN